MTSITNNLKTLEYTRPGTIRKLKSNEDIKDLKNPKISKIVAEAWQHLPSDITNAFADFLEIRDLSKLSLVSKVWNNNIQQNGIFQARSIIQNFDTCTSWFLDYSKDFVNLYTLYAFKNNQEIVDKVKKIDFYGLFDEKILNPIFDEPILDTVDEKPSNPFFENYKTQCNKINLAIFFCPFSIDKIKTLLAQFASCRELDYSRERIKFIEKVLNGLKEGKLPDSPEEIDRFTLYVSNGVLKLLPTNQITALFRELDLLNSSLKLSEEIDVNRFRSLLRLLMALNSQCMSFKQSEKINTYFDAYYSLLGSNADQLTARIGINRISKEFIKKHVIFASWCDDKAFTKWLVKNQAGLLGSVSKRLTNDEEIADLALEGNQYVWKEVGKELKNNTRFIIKWYPKVQKLPKNMQDNKGVIDAIINTDPYILRHVSAPLVKEYLKTDPKLLQYVIKLKSAHKCSLPKLKPYFDFAIKQDVDVLKSLPRKFLLLAMRIDGLYLQYLSPENKSDYEIVKKAAAQNEQALHFASPEMQKKIKAIPKLETRAEELEPKQIILPQFRTQLRQIFVKQQMPMQPFQYPHPFTMQQMPMQLFQHPTFIMQSEKTIHNQNLGTQPLQSFQTPPLTIESEQITPEQCQKLTKSEALSFISKSKNAAYFLNLSDEMRNDYEVVLRAVYFKPSNLQYAGHDAVTKILETNERMRPYVSMEYKNHVNSLYLQKTTKQFDELDIMEEEC